MSRNDLSNRLRPYMNEESFYKLVMFVACLAGEGIGYGSTDADELLYADILEEAPEEVINDVFELSEDFAKSYKGSFYS